MATNIFGGRANAVIATVDASFAAMGLTNINTLIVYEVDFSLRSWKPTRSINAITGVIAGRGYYFVAILDMDLTAYFAPPVGDAVDQDLLAAVERLTPITTNAGGNVALVPAGTLLSGVFILAPTGVSVKIGTAADTDDVLEEREIDGSTVEAFYKYFPNETTLYMTGVAGDTIFKFLKN